MTKDQELFWKILKCDTQWLAHTIGAELKNTRGAARVNKKADRYLSLMLSNNMSGETISAVVKTWLTVYRLPLEPERLEYFDRYHELIRGLSFEALRNLETVDAE